MVRYTDSAYASLAHRYWKKSWTAPENLRVYGEDASATGVGANFKIELSVDADSDFKESNLAAPLALIRSNLDHKSWFEEEATTLEWMAQTLGVETFAASSPAGSRWRSLTLWESDSLACEVRPSKEMRLRLKFHNLWLDFSGEINPSSRLLVNRDGVKTLVSERVVNVQNAEPSVWMQNLFNVLKIDLPGLCALTVDLGRHESLHIG